MRSLGAEPLFGFLDRKAINTRRVKDKTSPVSSISYCVFLKFEAYLVGSRGQGNSEPGYLTECHWHLSRHVS